MAPLCVRIFFSEDENDFHLFDGGSACPNEDCVDDGKIHMVELSVNSTIEDVKQALHTALREAEPEDYTVGYRLDEEDCDETLPESATLGEVFGDEVKVIQLNAKTQKFGKRRVYNVGNKTRKILLVDNRNCFTDINIDPRDLHTLDLNSTFWTRIDKLYVVDINSDPGPNPQKPNFQIRKYMLRAKGDIVIEDNGDILIGHLDVNTGVIVGLNDMPNPVRMLKGDGITKQYRDEWNEGRTLFRQRIFLAHTIIQDIAALSEAGAAIAGVALG